MFARFCRSATSRVSSDLQNDELKRAKIVLDHQFPEKTHSWKACLKTTLNEQSCATCFLAVLKVSLC